MVKLGFIDGYPDGSFRPDRHITRAEFAKTLVVALELEPSGTKVFNDTSNHWAKGYVSTAYANGMVKGVSDTEFAPDRTITREEMTAMLMRVIDAKKVKEPIAFTDQSDISDWAKEYIVKATESGIIDGYDNGQFKPKGLATKIIVTALFE